MVYRDDWQNYVFSDAIQINPRETLSKGTICKKVGMADIQEKEKNIKNYSLEEYNSGAKFRQGDTLFARITPCLENGKISKVNILEDDEIGFGSTEFIVMRSRPGITDSEFVYYLSLWEEVREPAIKSMTGTSGRQRVQNSIFDQLIIKLPRLDEQVNIGYFLSLFDKKIENNNKIIANLESQVQAIFKSWFVDFEPFQDGDFVESELGLIPEGWEVISIKNLMSFENGTEPGAKNYQPKEEGLLPFYRVGEMLNETDIYVEKPLLKGRITKDEDILVSFDGTVGRVVTGLSGGYSSGIKKVSSKVESINNNFIYVLFKSEPIQKIINQHASGTTILHASKSINYMFLPYNYLIYSKFSNLIEPFVEKIRLLKKQNQTLVQIRDALLPKLMSGEIDVSKIEIDQGD